MRIKLMVLLLAALSINGCSSLVLQPADLSWPVESVLKPDKKGMVEEDRHSISFNAKGLYFAEFQDSSASTGTELRMICDKMGYYFLTSKNFKNVYVFERGDDGLVMERKILISETGIKKPAFNQRSTHIQLVDGGKTYNLTHEGIAGDQK